MKHTRHEHLSDNLLSEQICELVLFYLDFSLTVANMESNQEDEEDENDYEMYNVQGSLREWVTRDEVRRFIARKFRQFLMTYVNPKNESGHPEYVRLIDEMVSGVYIGFHLYAQHKFYYMVAFLILIE